MKPRLLGDMDRQIFILDDEAPARPRVRLPGSVAGELSSSFVPKLQDDLAKAELELADLKHTLTEERASWLIKEKEMADGFATSKFFLVCISELSQHHQLQAT